MTDKTEEIVKEKQILSTLDTEIVSRFLGLWLMKMDIPQDIYDYVSSNVNKISDVDTFMIVTMILGAPDMKDIVLRKMIIND